MFMITHLVLILIFALLGVKRVSSGGGSSVMSGLSIMEIISNKRSGCGIHQVIFIVNSLTWWHCRDFQTQRQSWFHWVSNNKQQQATASNMYKQQAACIDDNDDNKQHSIYIYKQATCTDDDNK